MRSAGPSVLLDTLDRECQIVCRHEVSTEPHLDGGIRQCYAELRFAHAGEAKDMIPIVQRSSGFTTCSIRFRDRTCESVEGRSFHLGWPIRCEARRKRAVLRWCREAGGAHQSWRGMVYLIRRSEARPFAAVEILKAWKAMPSRRHWRWRHGSLNNSGNAIGRSHWNLSKRVVKHAWQLGGTKPSIRITVSWRRNRRRVGMPRSTVGEVERQGFEKTTPNQSHTPFDNRYHRLPAQVSVTPAPLVA